MDKISLMEAYLIEYLKVADLDDQTIVTQSLAGETAVFQALYPKMDFSLLINLAKKDPEAFERIVSEGYQVKFLTINGLKKLLELKVNKIAGKDYQENDKGIFDLEVDAEELKKIQTFASAQWQFKVKDNLVDIFVGQ